MTEKEYFCHPNALVESDDIGKGSRIWAFAHVMTGCSIGRDTNVGDHSFIESGVTIGSDVTIKNGVSIWAGVTIENRVFIGPNACFTNDLMPRSKAYHEKPVITLVRSGASIGANATIVAGVTIGRFAMIGAGAVVTKDVADYELVVGVPAMHLGWVSEEGERLHFNEGVALGKYSLSGSGAQERVTVLHSSIKQL
jgi:acetyltransferase-like isoleucine patch superfamily enzyme